MASFVFQVLLFSFIANIVLANPVPVSTRSGSDSELSLAQPVADIGFLVDGGKDSNINVIAVRDSGNSIAGREENLRFKRDVDDYPIFWMASDLRPRDGQKQHIQGQGRSKKEVPVRSKRDIGYPEFQDFDLYPRDGQQEQNQGSSHYNRSVPTRFRRNSVRVPDFDLYKRVGKVPDFDLYGRDEHKQVDHN